MMSNFLIKGTLAFILASFLTWGYLFMPQTFFSLDNKLRDYLFNIRGELPKNDNIVIVDIDEKALKLHGQWPWPRSIVSDLIQKISDADAGIIGLDIVFAEPDQTSPHTIASKIKEYTKTLDNYDLILAKTLASTPTVGGYVCTFDEKIELKAPLIPAIFIQKGLKDNRSLLEAKGLVLNIDILQDNFYSSGFFNIIPDQDGMIRRVPLLIRYNEMVYPSLALEMARIYSAISKVEIEGDDVGVKNIKLGDFIIPTDHAGRFIINFRGPKKHFNYISAADILNGHFDKTDISGKFVLVGTSAVGLYDLRATPFDSAIPGIEIHANILDNLLQSDFLGEPLNIVLYDIVIIWSIIFILIVIFSYINSWLYLPVATITIYILFEMFFYMLFEMGMVLNLLFPLLAFIVTLILSASIDYILASRQREFLKRIFAKKVSKSVMHNLINNSRENILEVREQDVAIFFSDIRGFTSISESIGSSQKLVALLNRYMTPIVDEIANSEGTVDKFIGDAIMAYWNAPNVVEHYADKAVSSALRQIEILEELNKDLEKEFNVILKIGIAIHTGQVTVGEMGSLGRSDYTIIGDNVNLASRLEGLNKVYGSTIIISEDTKNMLKEEYTLRSLDIVRVKGKQNAVEVFEVIPSTQQKIQDEIYAYDMALDTYREGKVKEAYPLFQTLHKQYEHKIYTVYLNRCKDYIENPDKEFDIVCTMSEK